MSVYKNSTDSLPGTNIAKPDEETIKCSFQYNSDDWQLLRCRYDSETNTVEHLFGDKTGLKSGNSTSELFNKVKLYNFIESTAVTQSPSANIDVNAIGMQANVLYDTDVQSDDKVRELLGIYIKGGGV